MTSGENSGLGAKPRRRYGTDEFGERADRSRAVIDSPHVRAAHRGPRADPARSTGPGRAASTTS
ncbi:hypothetical protein GCM10023205_38500 [Yinghuangia aomiensis]|uniref:Uncharacterized protein n=1 Tax=Yinghuangia aomiensis TaxID=676205 RepID=A0ABP9HFD9_9ACTN